MDDRSPEADERLKGLYLGDGVRVDFDGYHIVLRTDKSTIYLDSGVWERLKDYVKRQRQRNGI